MNTELTQYTKVAEKAMDKFYDGHYNAPAENDRSHVANIARSIMMHRDGIMNGGGFVTAVVENNLDQAISRADSVVSQHLRFFVFCKNYVYPQNQDTWL